ncbi:MAG: SulP family inorganic anion transporter [Burkholderiaceae bacterium]|nr:SulP family inorganic anion transporter [Burkholderiaceae bacterium]
MSASPPRRARLDLARFRPRLIDALSDYDRARLAKDVGAGITVGVVALPLAMAFAIASGVTPEAGIVTAVIAGFIIAALGGSRVQIGGPAGAFIVIIYGIIDRYGLANLLISTMLAGVLLFAMGMLKLGQLVRFIPVSIVIGFTNGIAVLIALSQVKDALGLSIDKLPADFFSQIGTLAGALHTINVAAVAICAASLALIVLWPKSYVAGHMPPWKRWVALVPGTIVVLVLATLAVRALHLPVETIGTRFGGIPQGLPSIALPAFSWDTVKQLIAPTITIALLGAIESLLCARVADNLIDDRHDPNQELMAQGVANVVAPLFGGIPATGTIARTVTNVKSGATSPIAGIVHALTLLGVLLVAAPLAEGIPLAALAAILLFVAWNMGEWREFARLRQFALTYRTILLTTFFLTVVFDLTVAVEVGMVLASLFFIYRISQLTRVEALALDDAPAGVEAYRLTGSLFFGAVSKLEALTDPARFTGLAAPTVVILDFSALLSLDTTGLETLEALRKQLARHGGALIVAGAHDQPLGLITRAGFVAHAGADNVVPDLPAALQRARTVLGSHAAAPAGAGAAGAAR